MPRGASLIPAANLSRKLQNFDGIAEQMIIDRITWTYVTGHIHKVNPAQFKIPTAGQPAQAIRQKLNGIAKEREREREKIS